MGKVGGWFGEMREGKLWKATIRKLALNALNNLLLLISDDAAAFDHFLTLNGSRLVVVVR